ncbi:hypothetical protein ISN44_As10g015850 [Arabidopsis suecica]|uniref:DUF1985 domain-containing protein n=1 Tax=Arabidopsis suecica TaxID=45249 RepID=A0A8T1ZZG5_ARASU|nr:hypothetical protein ISN44_As10g015850 [Arabidopsis suecica]
MPSNATLADHFLSKEDLPERIFQVDRYPGHAVRINSYSKPQYLIDILTALEGTPELEKLLSSPLGSLFSLPVRQSSVSGQLVHQMLCRQLHTTNVDETWFVYGGQPLRFSLTEFHQVTGLCCSPLPPVEQLAAATTHENGSAPYWYQLIGPTLGAATVKEIVGWLKDEPNMPIWRRFRLALIVIVEGILLCKTQPVKPSVEVVEMVKNVDFFLNYPWGRHSFQRILRMVKVGEKIETKADLINKLKQSTMAVHGFPLAIQLFAFRSIPLLLQYLPHSEDDSTFLHKTLTRLPKCKSFHTSNILAVENDPSMVVLYPHPDGPPFGSSESEDDKVGNLERLIFAGFPFTKAFWCSGDGSLPSLYTSRRRKERTATSTTSDSDSSEMPRQRKSSKPKFINTAEDVNTLLDKKLKGFKASLLADLRGMMRANESPPAVQSPKGKSPSHVSEARSSEPSRVTRSGRAGQYVRVPTAPGHSLTQRDGTRSDTIEPEGSTSATCTAKKNSHPPSSRPTSATAVPHFSSQPPSPCSTAREQPLEPPAVSPVKQRFRFAQKKTPAKAFSLLAEATHTSTDRHCSTVVNELPPSVPPVSDHLKKLSSPSVSLTTAGDPPVEVPPVAAVDITQFVLVDPPDEPLDVFSPMDVNAEVMPTRSLPRVIPVLPSPSILPSQRPQTRRSKRLRSSAAPEVNPPAPAPKLRLRHTSEDVKLKAAS